MTKQQKRRLNKINKGLRGYKMKLAESLGVSVSTISRVLTGKHHNIKILASAKKLHGELLAQKEKNLKIILS